MKAQLIPIGNSQGLRIPKPLIQHCGFQKTVKIEVQGNQLIISPIPKSRQGWDEAFAEMSENQDDSLLLDDSMQHSWDEEEWTW